MRTKFTLAVGVLALLVLVGFQFAKASSTRTNESALTAAFDSTPKSCCVHDAKVCCDGPMYCPHTGEVNDTCCCDVVDGKWVCRESGAVSDACCCIPVADASGSDK